MELQLLESLLAQPWLPQGLWFPVEAKLPHLVSWEMRSVNTCYEELKEVSLSQSRSERAAKGKVNGKMLLQSFRFCSRSYNT